MPVHIEASNQTCALEQGDIRLHGPASAVRLSTDDGKSMSRAELNGQFIWITEAEADALTVAGALDGRHHVKVSDGDSVI
ncbi:DUF3203 family protein [Pseudomonas gingeri]|uniref:DUF3203 family protein n=1 Tax=Pseudomonas gingeri TaxID=117681 RepID=UPI0015A41C87|nr:DUF3203 family protein [Pseudomonas gingeri]NWA24293.1 DUF3203 family protein [Pseudomonas gingeri]NWD66753.1 DUF3203 family protein [Pseudomonas gingeri]NWD76029.1 DUF3203 family protein [Pseudomonas gingeri]